MVGANERRRLHESSGSPGRGSGPGQASPGPDIAEALDDGTHLPLTRTARASTGEPPATEEGPWRLPGVLGWLLWKFPELTCLVGAIVFTAGGIAMLLSNPAGNSTTGDQYGPDAPLQGWVLAMALLAFALAGLSVVFALLVLWQRITGQRREHVARINRIMRGDDRRSDAPMPGGR